jgi:FtsZ-interacting cell division protein YlmF/transcriptional regulator with XRE-family HTH domain
MNDLESGRPDEGDSGAPELTEQRFAENLRLTRESNGVSQVRLAQEMSDRGWPWRQQTVTRIENGQRTIRLGEARAVAEILGVSLDRLTEPTEEIQELELLGEWIRQVKAAWRQIADGTVQLLKARRPLRMHMDVAGPEPSPRMAGTMQLARAVSRLSPETAVSQGIARLAAKEPPDADTRAQAVVTFRPRNSATKYAIVDAMRDGQHVIVDVSDAPADECRRILDFLEGAAAVRGGSLEAVGQNLYRAGPAAVDLDALQLIWDDFPGSPAPRADRDDPA